MEVGANVQLVIKNTCLVGGKVTHILLGKALLEQTNALKIYGLLNHD